MVPDRPDLTPEQEQEVRRRLADARHDEPIPQDVAERLDRVLTGLSAEPVREATVVRLATRRRRAGALLAVAAAVVVGGVAVGQLVGGPSDSGSADSAAEAPTAARSEAGAAADEGGRGEAPSAGAVAQPGAVQARVRPDRFAADVARIRARRTTTTKDSQLSQSGGSAKSGEQYGSEAVCTPGSWGRGVYVPVRYGRAAGYVVFRRPQGDTQVADLFLCGSELAVRSITLPPR